MAPVAGGIADRQKYGLVAALRFGQVLADLLERARIPVGEQILVAPVLVDHRRQAKPPDGQLALQASLADPLLIPETGGWKATVPFLETRCDRGDRSSVGAEVDDCPGAERHHCSRASQVAELVLRHRGPRHHEPAAASSPA